ncbi:hypothetical protein [Winogradskyella sp. A2]|uniref:hypothetical protein n=1 Tax=Winogradskyella sp. A2 TaxID=3366944 RepID=UPI00398C8235
MTRVFILILFMLSSVFAFSQKTSLLKNFNFRAKDLKHDLNKDGDTLLLESNQTIYQIEIYNSFYEKKVAINRYKSKIPITDLPEGRYVVEAVLSDRRIIMTLIRHVTAKEALLMEVGDISIAEPGIETESIPNETLAVIEINKEEFVESSTEEISEEVAIVDKKEEESIVEVSSEGIDNETIASERDNTRYHHSPAALLNTRLKRPSERSNKYYWVVKEINNGNSSSKTKKLVQEDMIYKLIKQNKIEIKTASGRKNRVTIWEVYDTTKFMKGQSLDRNFITNSDSDCFNHTPFYTTAISRNSR